MKNSRKRVSSLAKGSSTLPLYVAGLLVITVIGTSVGINVIYNFIGFQGAGTDGNTFQALVEDNVKPVCTRALNQEEPPEDEEMEVSTNNIEIGVTESGEEPDPNVLNATGNRINTETTIEDCKMSIEVEGEERHIIRSGDWALTISCVEECTKNDGTPEIKIAAEGI